MVCSNKRGASDTSHSRRECTGSCGAKIVLAYIYVVCE